jgi:hypothetical protein
VAKKIFAPDRARIIGSSFQIQEGFVEEKFFLPFELGHKPEPRVAAYRRKVCLVCGRDNGFP